MSLFEVTPVKAVKKATAPCIFGRFPDVVSERTRVEKTSWRVGASRLARRPLNLSTGLLELGGAPGAAWSGPGRDQA